MSLEESKIKGPKGKIDPVKAFDVLKSFSDETIYAAAMDIVFSLDLKYKEDYSSFIKKLFSLIKEPYIKIRLEQSLIGQINILKKQKDKKEDKNIEQYNITEIFDNPDKQINNLSGNHRLQLEITNYILDYFKKKDFVALEKCLDILIDKNILMNTVKNFIKKELQNYINNNDAENIKRMNEKYINNNEIIELIKTELDKFIINKKYRKLSSI